MKSPAKKKTILASFRTSTIDFVRESSLHNRSSYISTKVDDMDRRLEEEPMLVARELVEDAMDVLADVTDIDRFLQQRPVPTDGGHSLLSRRHDLITSIAASLKVHQSGAEDSDDPSTKQKARQNADR